MTRPNITPGDWDDKEFHFFMDLSGKAEEAHNARAISALPELLAALENALESLQQAVHPLCADGATGAAEDCEDSAALITEALTKAGYTFP